MAWFVGQSALMIGAAFLLGLLVGWLVWGVARRPAVTSPAPVRAPARPLPPAPVIKMPIAPPPTPESDDDPEHNDGLVAGRDEGRA